MIELERAVASLPRRFPGPGGACAVLRDGEVLVRHSWGWANAERRIPFTPATLFRICSITKQFTSALVLDRCPDPAVLEPALRARLPLLDVVPPVPTLMHNQSGLRDYWAVAMLHGAPAESAFGPREGDAVLAGTRTLQFEPGTRYSYCNQNFRLLSDALEDQAGRSFAELLRTQLFDPAGMEAALLAAETRALPDGTEGYEGTQAAGFRPAVNRIVWTGDAGIAASLDDMIAWERWIDRTRDDADSLYCRLSAPVAFSDGGPAGYGFGLGRSRWRGRALTGHGGALRGWRSHRLHLRAGRISVVVLFNHMGDAAAAAMQLLAALLGKAEPPPAKPIEPPAWSGAYLEPETGLAVRIEPGAPGSLVLRYDRNPERLPLQPDGSAGTQDGTQLRAGEGGLWMHRPLDNQTSCLQPCDPEARPEGRLEARPGAAGRYRCAELDAELTIEAFGDTLYGAFSGRLGAGRMELLDPVAADVWALPCPRALDHTPPGDWTLAIRRDPAGEVASLQVGCWLARGLDYERIRR